MSTKMFCPEDDQSLLIETSSCTPSSFEILHGVTAVSLTYIKVTKAIVKPNQRHCWFEGKCNNNNEAYMYMSFACHK